MAAQYGQPPHPWDHRNCADALSAFSGDPVTLRTISEFIAAMDGLNQSSGRRAFASASAEPPDTRASAPQSGRDPTLQSVDFPAELPNWTIPAQDPLPRMAARPWAPDRVNVH
jgi:hypothetical protein